MQRFLGLVFAVAAMVGWLAAASAGPKDIREALTIVSASGRHAFTVEVAISPEAQARGLMFRRSLEADAGMLFVYPEAHQITMWMKNTHIPLDMLFIDDAGKVSHIVQRTVPLSLELIRSRGPAMAVLELNGGTVARLGIDKGDRVLSQRLGTK